MKNSVKNRKFLDFFPTPKFLTMTPVGLDISDRKVRFLEFEEKKDGIAVKRFGDMDIPEGVIVSGSIKDVDRLREVLSEFSKKYKLEFVRVSLPEERAYLTKMEVANTSPSKLRDTIAFQLEEYVPVSADSAVFDYQVIKKKSSKDDTLEVIVSVLPEKEMLKYVEMFMGTGMTPVSFEIEAQAIARAVLSHAAKDTYMIMDFGRTRTGVSIISDGVIQFTSTIDIGSETITEAIKKTFSISYEEAEKMKNERSLSKSEKDREFFIAAISTLSSLQDEIDKLYVYWQTEHQSDAEDKKIKKIILCGGGANLKGLEDYFATSLKVKVETANPWCNVGSFEDYIPNIPLKHALGYASVIGLALPRESVVS